MTAAAGRLRAPTEREKMLAGEPYLASDPVLRAARTRARAILRRYDRSADGQAASRERLLRELFAQVGTSVEIEPPLFCDYGANVSVGDDVYVNTGVVILDCANVTIGSRVWIGPRVQLVTAHHPVDAEERARFSELASPIVIEDDVWIGAGVIVLPGVTVGRGSTIGAGSIVTNDVPPGVVAFGNPCRVSRRLK